MMIVLLGKGYFWKYDSINLIEVCPDSYIITSSKVTYG